MIIQLHFTFQLLIVVILLGSNSGGKNNNRCNLCKGNWDHNLNYLPVGCNYSRPFSNYLKTNQTPFERPFNLLMLGDSNSVMMIENLRDFKKCPFVLGDKRLLTPHLSIELEKLRLMKSHTFSVFPYPTEFMNYCIEFKGRGPDERIYFRTNEGVIDHGIKVYYERFHEFPNIIEFSIHLWEMVRIREEKSCENGEIQALALQRWNRTALDAPYLHVWTAKMEEALAYTLYRAKSLNALVFTRTVQLPAIKPDGSAVHTNVHSAAFIAQINSCIRAAAKKTGVHLLDVERIVSSLNRTTYLRDSIHAKTFVNDELWNIIWIWFMEHQQSLNTLTVPTTNSTMRQALFG